ncbi:MULTISPECIES: OmpA family protein [Aequorivita]|uniref:OmpA family protein n=2 Tax=Aequorivita TaxID=153265 RepID=A0AB35YZJ8_9FLAO|nr:OmpA family protein [Aequorivita sp. Ant34-E75]WGF91330.1 OmpA family protein [Aequorivita sp. Ant34-E75]
MNTLLRNIFIFALILLTSGSAISQKKDIQKANKKFDRYAYIDAREIYLKVVEDGYESAQIFQNLGDTYYFNSEYGNAAKWYLKLVNKYPDEAQPEYFYKAAQSLKSLGRYQEADALLQDYIAKGGTTFIVKTYNDDPEYLKSIVFDSKEIDIEKVAVNSPTSDFGPAFYMNNRIIYASAGENVIPKFDDWTEEPYLDLFIADRGSDGQLRNSVRVGGDVNSEYNESTPFFTKDGNTMFFTRNRIIEGKKDFDKSNKFKTLRLTIFKATRAGENTWRNIIELPFNSESYSVAHPTLSPDEKRLYFASDMPGTLGMSDIWYVDILGNDTYGPPVNMGPEINTGGRDSFPFISDNNNLYFASDGRSGMGGYDVFVVSLDDSGKAVGTAQHLGPPTNSAKDDFGFIINEKERIAYLSSNRGGNRGSADDDIYLLKEGCSITVKGIVFDVDTNEPLADAQVSLLDNFNQLVSQTTSGTDGSYKFIAGCGIQYIVRGIKEDYTPYETSIKTPFITGTVDVPIPLKRIGCPPNDLNCILDLQPIYFDFDKSNIRPDAEIELAKILAALKQYDQLKINIESHTDSRGNDNYNLALSERRAQSTLKWLVKKGIDKSRLTAKGFGESRLINKCSNGVKCTAEEHQLNRRSMFIIQD